MQICSPFTTLVSLKQAGQRDSLYYFGTLFDASMFSSDRVEQVASSMSPPQLRVVGFCAKNSADASTDIMSASSHSVVESPLSQMLRSATWPCLRLRLGKDEISRPLALASQTHCSTSPKLMLHARSVSQHSISSSPISIPRAGRLV